MNAAMNKFPIQTYQEHFQYVRLPNQPKMIVNRAVRIPLVCWVRVLN